MTRDRIEKKVFLRASVDRVWDAISDSEQFGRWFGARFDGPFVAGTGVRGVMTPTEVDSDVAKAQEPYAGMADTWEVVALEQHRRFAFRGHPLPPESGDDYTDEPTTLVEFTLEEAPGGVWLRVVESGFDAIPEPRRSTAFEGNSEGWATQVQLVAKYLGLETRV